MTYGEQYNRVKRYYDRFAELDKGRIHNADSDNYVDDIYAFFQNCYHLKDWIKNDGSIGIPGIKDRVEQHINGSRSLRLCADLCNGTKHLARDRSDRSKENPKFGGKTFGLGIGSETTLSLKYQVEAYQGAIDAFKLATDCVEAWEVFLKQENLLPVLG